MTLDEIHDLLLEPSDDEEASDDEMFAIEPPIENANADTNCDTDNSDDEVLCNPDHLPRRILFSNTIPASEQETPDVVGTESPQPSSKRGRALVSQWLERLSPTIIQVGDSLPTIP